MPNDPKTETEAHLLIDTLKEILKERKITYRLVAEKLELSLPTVKRMLNQPNLPLDRLLMICEIANIQAEEVFAQAQKQRPTHTIFSAEQDEWFFQHPEFLSYFMELFENGKSPDEIARENDLTELSTGRYLSELEKVGLIERDTGNHFKILASPPIGFGPDSKVLRANHTEFLQHTVAQVLSPNTAPGNFAILKPLLLTSNLYRDLISELKDLIDKYAYLSEHPGSRNFPGRSKWNLAVACGPNYPENPAPIVNL